MKRAYDTLIGSSVVSCRYMNTQYRMAPITSSTASGLAGTSTPLLSLWSRRLLRFRVQDTSPWPLARHAQISDHGTSLNGRLNSLHDMRRKHIPLNNGH